MMNPRKPTEAEKKELVAFVLAHDFENDENERENVEGFVENAAIAVFDDYVTDSPGYAGKVMVVVYAGGTILTETYSWNSLDKTIRRDVAILDV